MNDIPRQKLQFIIIQYGRSVCEEPKRCEALLRDLCPEYKREINLLIGALKEKIPADLMNNHSGTAREVLLARLAQRLYDHLGMAEEFARWAVESWAAALGDVSSPAAAMSEKPLAKEAEATDDKKWWIRLDSKWRKIFKRAIEIHHEPNTRELREIKRLQTLDCKLPWFQITTLEPVAFLTNLQKLDCNGTQIADLTPLGDMKHLKVLYCNDTPITTLEPLRSLTQLRILHCRGTHIRSLDPLEELSFLQELHCWDTQIQTLEPLRNLAMLRELDCDRTQISSLEPLRNLRNLQVLNCNSNQIRSLDPLRNLANLRMLNCNSNYISSLEPLRNLSSLQILNCNSNQISSLEHLRDLMSLQKLGCDDTQISKLRPLRNLMNLRKLHCRKTRVGLYERMKFSLKHPLCEIAS